MATPRQKDLVTKARQRHKSCVARNQMRLQALHSPASFPKFRPPNQSHTTSVDAPGIHGVADHQSPYRCRAVLFEELHVTQTDFGGSSSGVSQAPPERLTRRGAGDLVPEPMTRGHNDSHSLNQSLHAFAADMAEQLPPVSETPNRGRCECWVQGRRDLDEAIRHLERSINNQHLEF